MSAPLDATQSNSRLHLCARTWEPLLHQRPVLVQLLLRLQEIPTIGKEERVVQRDYRGPYNTNLHKPSH